jgi:uncharacterized membrane protein YraQ (UPF0718 family)
MFTLGNQINDFIIVLFSILVEGMPFILIGSILSAIVQRYLKQKHIEHFLPKNRFMQKVAMCLLGNLVPVCECGNVPMAKRMIQKNMNAGLVISFLLAAPVFNPLVIASTLAAFPNNPSILVYRLIFTMIVAITASYLMEKLPTNQTIHVTAQPEPLDPKLPLQQSHQHSVIGIIKEDFIQMTSLFLIGAIIAALVQNLLPKEFILSFNSQEWLAILAMMVMAFIISICANVDAFFALAYTQIFPTSSILAFLVFGPMFDIKSIPMFKSIFTWRGLIILLGFCGSLIFLLSYLYFLFT